MYSIYILKLWKQANQLENKYTEQRIVLSRQFHLSVLLSTTPGLETHCIDIECSHDFFFLWLFMSKCLLQKNQFTGWLTWHSGTRLPFVLLTALFLLSHFKISNMKYVYWRLRLGTLSSCLRHDFSDSCCFNSVSAISCGFPLWL